MITLVAIDVRSITALTRIADCERRAICSQANRATKHIIPIGIARLQVRLLAPFTAASSKHIDGTRAWRGIADLIPINAGGDAVLSGRPDRQHITVGA